MLPHFPEEAGGKDAWIQFVTCEELLDAVNRGLTTWSSNNRLLKFRDITSASSCASRSADIKDECPWQMYIGTDDGEENPKVAAYVMNHRSSAFNDRWFTEETRSSAGVTAAGVDQLMRSVLRFQTHICFYLDATFCSWFQNLSSTTDILLRVGLLTLFVLALLRLLHVALMLFFTIFMARTEEGGVLCVTNPKEWSVDGPLDFLTSLSPILMFLVLFGAAFPAAFYVRIYLPCVDCYDFEAVVAHEVGHVLGFSHPDEHPEINLKATCESSAFDCERPFGSCIEYANYESLDEKSIMQSLTQSNARTCLSQGDFDGLHSLYPVCDGLTPTEITCVKSLRLSGWLRLAYVVGGPLLLAMLLILPPLSLLRCRERRRISLLLQDLDEAEAEQEAIAKELRASKLRRILAETRAATVARGGTPNSKRPKPPMQSKRFSSRFFRTNAVKPSAAATSWKRHGLSARLGGIKALPIRRRAQLIASQGGANAGCVARALTNPVAMAAAMAIAESGSKKNLHEEIHEEMQLEQLQEQEQQPPNTLVMSAALALAEGPALARASHEEGADALPELPSVESETDEQRRVRWLRQKTERSLGEQLASDEQPASWAESSTRELRPPNPAVTDASLFSGVDVQLQDVADADAEVSDPDDWAPKVTRVRQ